VQKRRRKNKIGQQKEEYKNMPTRSTRLGYGIDLA
jgi:hypothetical protein